MAITSSAGRVSLSSSFPAGFLIRNVSSEMVHAAPLALLAVNLCKAVGALGIHICVPERHLLLFGTGPGADRLRDRQCLVDGTQVCDGHLGFLKRVRTSHAVQFLAPLASGDRAPITSGGVAKSPPCV